MSEHDEQGEYPLVDGLDDERGKVLVINGCYQCHYRVKDVRTPYNDWVCRKSGYDIRERSEYTLPRWCPLQDVGSFLTGKKIMNALKDGLISVEDMQSALLDEIMRKNKESEFIASCRHTGRPTLVVTIARECRSLCESYLSLGRGNPLPSVYGRNLELAFSGLDTYTNFIMKYAPKIKYGGE